MSRFSRLSVIISHLCVTATWCGCLFHNKYLEGKLVVELLHELLEIIVYVFGVRQPAFCAVRLRSIVPHFHVVLT